MIFALLRTLAVLIFIQAMAAGAASFDCSKAVQPDERAICADPNLSNEDEQLAGLYAKLLQLMKGDDRQELVDTQRKWLQARAGCGSDGVCIQSALDRETKRLQALLAEPQTAAVDLFRRTAQCSHCNLSGAQLSGIQPATHGDNGQLACNIDAVANGTFDGAHIDHANFIACRTKSMSALSSMSWNGASLKGTNFTGTNLGGNTFEKADLTGANLSGANLFWVDMANARLTNANLSGATSDPDAMNGICSDFSGADFTGAVLSKARLCGNFAGANFAGADLREASISGLAAHVPDNNEAAVVDPADQSSLFDGKVNLTGADLRGAIMFSESKLTPRGFAFAILCRTVMPDGAVSDRDCR
jgi:uncharacterized protein YjbI with pentapeptide repeats